MRLRNGGGNSEGMVVRESEGIGREGVRGESVTRWDHGCFGGRGRRCKVFME